MARSCEATGKTVADATRTGLLELGISKDEAEVTVINRGGRRFFGLLPGAAARVRVSQRLSTHVRAEEIVSTLLRHMRFSAQLDVTEEKNAVVINIETAGADGLLIGKAGFTISALEYIANRMLQREGRRGGRVILDVGGYKRKRDASGKVPVLDKEFEGDDDADEAPKPQRRQPSRGGSRGQGGGGGRGGRGRRRRGRPKQPVAQKTGPGGGK
jgi:spoIIIJ-associated protein